VKAAKKGGKPMQKPIRYYITKDGEEPTVRSVEVALENLEVFDATELVGTPQKETSGSRRSMVGPMLEVKRLVKESVRRQIPHR
jgi:hypothetical protein